MRRLREGVSAISASRFSAGEPNAVTACGPSAGIGAISAIFATRFRRRPGRARPSAAFGAISAISATRFAPRVVLSAAKDLIAGASGESLLTAVRSFAALRMTGDSATRFRAGVVLTDMTDPHRLVGRHTPQHCAWLSSESVSHNGLWREGILSHRYIGSNEVTALHALRRCRSVP